MENTHPSAWPGLWRLALLGLSTAFAWIILSALFGAGASGAHADERDDNKSLLGAVTKVVDKTAESVTEIVTEVTEPVAKINEMAVETVVEIAPKPVQEPVREVVETVDTVVTKVTEPVKKVVASKPVTTITEPVVEIVKKVPVVGTVVSGVGADDAVNDLGETVDDTLDGVGGVVDDVTESVDVPPAAGVVEKPVTVPDEVVEEAAEALVPAASTPDAAESARVVPTEAAERASVKTADASADEISLFTGDAASASPFFSLADAAAFTAATTTTASAASSSPADAPTTYPAAGGLCPPLASSSGPAGAGLGALALVAMWPLAAHRAWVRRAGHSNDDAPPAPAKSTDPSPD